jgi:hypothetical protein
MFTNEVPSHPMTQLNILRARPGNPLKAVIVSRMWRGLETHWYGGRTIRCPKEGVCRACSEGCAKRWIAYVAVRGFDNEIRALAGLTPPCCEQLRTFVREPNGLLGARVVFHRAGRKANSLLEVSLYGWCDEIEEMPMSRLEETLALIFRANEGTHT